MVRYQKDRLKETENGPAVVRCNGKTQIKSSADPVNRIDADRAADNKDSTCPRIPKICPRSQVHNESADYEKYRHPSPAYTKEKVVCFTRLMLRRLRYLLRHVINDDKQGRNKSQKLDRMEFQFHYSRG